MKFKLVESLDKYYRITVIDDLGNNKGGLFRGLNQLTKDLYNNDDPFYDNINDPLSELEYMTYYPEDFENSKAIFAYKSDKYEELSETILDLKAELNQIGWDLIISKSNRPENIVYEDEEQVAYINV